MGCCVSDEAIPEPEEQEDSFPKHSVITCRSCLLHEKPSDTSEFVRSTNGYWLRITQGTVVEVVSTKGSFSQIEAHSLRGWVRKAIISEITATEVIQKRRQALLALWILNFNSLGGGTSVCLLKYLIPGDLPWWLMGDVDQAPRIRKILPPDTAGGAADGEELNKPVQTYVATRSTIIASRSDKLIINGKVFDSDPFQPCDILAWRNSTIFPDTSISFARPGELPGSRWARRAAP
eukprot:TRINITY_DN421_c1_g1_i1.p1 TRINITY_DN421_c1_g1~~TRINITY_DN421_c1_g1_i1.p1  ORF type:complete len:235 (+),score=22.12 TRINITY_DN421_c1_g1_i1:44-748(+)